MIKKPFSLYSDKGSLTLILFDGKVYYKKVEEKDFHPVDGFELSPNTPYHHIGKEITPDELDDVLLKEKVITLINL